MRAYADPLAQAEIDRLTAKLAVLEAGQPLVSEALRDEIHRLTAENKRLRAALHREPGENK